MTSRELLQAALNHKDTGRVPMDFGATNITGMHVNCVAGLRDYYGLEKRPVKVHDPYQMLGLFEEDLMQALGIDVEGVPGRTNMFGFENRNWKPYTLANGLEVLVAGDFRVTGDAAGNTYIYPEGDITVPPAGRMPKGGYFFDAIIRQEPFDEDELLVEDNLEEFGPVTEKDLAYFTENLQKVAATGRGVVAGFGGTALGDIAMVPGPFMKHPKGIRDIEEWYVSCAIRKEFVAEIFDRQTEIAVENLARYAKQLPVQPDVVVICGTDFGTQNSTFCSADTFRELYMPYYKRVNSWIHANTGWKTFKHSCGAVGSFIPLFIEAGFDILNPVQCSCVGMEPERIKAEYGRDIVFWGGGVDTQALLPFGKPAEIREQVLRRCEIFAKGGGYVFNAIHNVQGDTPIANIVAMVDAVREFNGR